MSSFVGLRLCCALCCVVRRGGMGYICIKSCFVLYCRTWWYVLYLAGLGLRHIMMYCSFHVLRYMTFFVFSFGILIFMLCFVLMYCGDSWRRWCGVVLKDMKNNVTFCGVLLHVR